MREEARIAREAEIEDTEKLEAEARIIIEKTEKLDQWKAKLQMNVETLGDLEREFRESIEAGISAISLKQMVRNLRKSLRNRG